MKLVSLNLSNYKSIKQFQEIRINEKMTVFAGKNNTGKTSLIEGIYKIFNSTLTDLVVFTTETTQLNMVIELNQTELIYFNNLFTSCDLKAYSYYKYKINFYFDPNLQHTTIIGLFGVNESVDEISPERYFQILENHSSGNTTSYNYQNKTDSGTTYAGRPPYLDGLFNFLKERIVFISGTRYVLNKETVALHDNLNINGTNLNAYLLSLNTNYPNLFNKIVNTFKELFVDVTTIGTPMDTNNQTNISLYFEGIDKPIPLYSCGSGFTHVLMLLCVLYSQENRVVLFDEPHVYLHPSAEKAIYDLMSEHNEHQYILTTHSPILINYPFEKSLYLVSKNNGLSTFTKLDSVREILNEIGVSNSDFALSEKVLFVEGKTEEIVIPKILGYFGMKQLGYNYRIINMRGTGNDFTNKGSMQNNKDKLDQILGGISETPIPYVILIDLDERNEKRIGELLDKYGERIRVLKRREIENYFIDCYKEIAKVINKHHDNMVATPQEIEQYVMDYLSQTENEYLYRTKQIKDPKRNIIGSHVLNLLFTEYKIEYNKVAHGNQLVESILQDHPEKLMPIKDLLEDFIKD